MMNKGIFIAAWGYGIPESFMEFSFSIILSELFTYIFFFLFFLPFCMAAKPPVTFRLFVGNLNFNKMATELKTGLSEFFAKNDLAVVGVRVGFSR